MSSTGITRISTLAMEKDDRLQRLFACVGLIVDDNLLGGDLQEFLLTVMLDIAPEFVPPFCGEPEDEQAWRDLIDKWAPGQRPSDD